MLFYDRSLSFTRTVACASCHLQAFAFGDTNRASVGVNGTTERHSMRLINSRFAREVRVFWDERADSLEDQATQPIRDHIEMGFSGSNGDPPFSALIDRLESLDYYQELFTFVYGDADVTEERIQRAIAQFIRSIQSFDSRYDDGRRQVGNDSDPFPNFSQRENLGKQLFMTPAMFNTMGVRIDGGLGCANCHQPPEFDIEPDAQSNGVIVTIDGSNDETSVTRAPIAARRRRPERRAQRRFLPQRDHRTGKRRRALQQHPEYREPRPAPPPGRASPEARPDRHRTQRGSSIPRDPGGTRRVH